MAGGAGQRMKESRGGAPKPLVAVAGVAMLERNVQALIRHGIVSVVVAVPAEGGEIQRFCQERLAPLVESFGGDLSLLQETSPLGTLGAAALVPEALGAEIPREGLSPRDMGDALLVVNADNLTSLDLRALVADHRTCGAALTLAVHEESFRLDFGQVEAQGGWVRAYQEKPVHKFPVASAISALGIGALEAMAPGEPCSLPELTGRLIERGARVRAHGHQEPWIDVNDDRAVVRAEALIRKHRPAFELWASEGVRQVVGALLLRRDGSVLLERRSAGAELAPGVWDTPGGKMEPGESPSDAIVRELREELGLEAAPVEGQVVFDDFDGIAKRCLRHHVFKVEGSFSGLSPREGQRLRWFSPGELRDPAGTNPVVHRSLVFHGTSPETAPDLETPLANL